MRGEALAIAATLLTPSAVSRMAWIRIGFLTACLIEIMDVPGAFHLRQHDDVELLADRGDDLLNVVEHPGRVERVDARPQSGLAEIATLGHGDETRACCRFGVGGNGVLEIAEHHVDLMHEFRHPRAHLLDMRRHEMNHALQPQRQVAQRRRRPDGEGFKEIARQFHVANRGSRPFPRTRCSTK
jgi:hypothetical protein